MRTRLALPRLATVVGTAVLAVLTTQNAYSNIRAIDVNANTIAASNARVLDLIARDTTDPDRWKKAAASPRTLLRKAPLNAQAVSQLGLILAATGQTDQANNAMALAQRITRRDLASGFWAVEWAVSHGSVNDVLKRYDVLLRVYPETGTQLFPVLAAALDDAAIREGLVAMTQARAPWMQHFIDYAMTIGKAEEIAQLFLSGKTIPKDNLSTTIDQQMIGALVHQYRLESARRYYLTLPGSAASDFSDAGFSSRTIHEDRAPLTWSAANTPNVQASFSEKGAAPERELTATAFAGTRGIVARKLLHLPAGLYSFAATISVDGPGGVDAVFSCVTNDAIREFRRIGLRASGTERVEITPLCSDTFVAFELRADAGQRDVNVVISNVRLNRIR